jgi:serine/threonine protein kinase
MSPEQAKGKKVDKRTDIFAFGSVLYEMLTGRKAFEGEDVPEVLANIINKEPDLNSIDLRVLNLLGRCLRKDSKKRLRDIGDARNEIEDLLDPASENEPSTFAAAAPLSSEKDCYGDSR